MVVDPSKLEAVIYKEKTNNVSEVKSFLGLDEYIEDSLRDFLSWYFI